jgi:predicted metalloprotease with PDZ domain
MDSADTAAVTYHVTPIDPAGHIFEVSCRVSEPDPDGQTFSLPAWIPGSYLIREYARHVVSVSASDGERPVSIRKIDKATWRAAPADGPLVIRAEVYANDFSVRGSFLDTSRGLINGVCLFFLVHGKADLRCIVHVDPPAGIREGQWQLATALNRLTGRPGEFGAFDARAYDELIDHPLLLGPLTSDSFDVAGVPHQISIAGRHDADMDRLGRDLARICKAHVEFFGGLPPMQRYHFLLLTAPDSYGGLEHRDSSTLICSRRDLPRVGEAAASAEYRRFLGLASHEYFHLWNIKRIRPAAFSPYRLDRENYTRQLWLFEGVTSYYDDLALLRAGLIDVPAYLELLGRTLTSVYRSGGRRRQTLEEASFDAWIKFYRQDENAPNAIVSYYGKGAMVALALDLELRLRTEGRCALDDLMRALWAEYGDAGQGLPEGTFERLAEEVSGVALEDFFRQSLRSSVDPPVGILLAQFGVRMRLRAAEGESDAGGKPGRREQRPRAWLGIRTRAQGDRVFVSHVLAGGPAHSTGLAAADELVAMNGLRVSAAGLDALLDELPIGVAVQVHAFRRDELLSSTIQPIRPPRDTAYLALETEPDNDTLARRQAWLGT